MQKREVRLRRGMGLAEATLIGVGAMVGAGIFVLTGIAAGAAGPALVLAFALNGLIALTAGMAYAELGSTFPQAGGGYAWAKRALPGPFGFLAGWISWFSHSVACSLYGLGFGAYFAQLLHAFGLGIPYLSDAVEVKVLAVIVVAVFTFVNYRGSAETGRAGNLITLGQMAILLVFVVFGLFALRGAPQWPENFSPFLPQGVSGLLMAMGLTFVAFEGYEIIAQCGEEVRQPRRNIPRAIFLSIGLVVIFYVVIAFVMLGAVRAPAGTPVWQYLGGYAELAVLEASRQFVPGGILLLLVGGLFATASALNATLYSSSRVSFAMGRDFNLPGVFARINKKRRTPHGAILFSALVILAMAIALPLEEVASATDITFMFLFAMINLSLIALRYQKPNVKRGFRVPLHPWLPLVSTACLMGLAVHLFRFSSTAWFVAMGWIVLGLIVFREYASKREQEETGARPLLEESTIEPIKDPILVAVSNPNSVEPVTRIACAIARQWQTEVIALHVVEVPAQLPRSEGRRFLERAEPLFESAVKIGEEMKTPVFGALWVSSNLQRGMLEAIAEKKPSLVVLGWRGYGRTRERFFGTTLDPILRAAPANIALLRWKNKKRKLENVLVGVTASSHCHLAIEIAQSLERQLKAKCRYLHVMKRGTPMDVDTESAFLCADEKEKPPLDLEVVQARSTAAKIIEESEEADLLILGAAREGVLSQMVFGEKARKIARRAKCSVLLAKRKPGPGRSLLRRLFTGQE
ncbi:MAG: amino acid permease [Armatimonadetes bacterium]|nr:amino acid permease [Armatimonadota bacterium]NIM24565.1 amino acid permease [Armatimonadota bacterium]NIM68441.1 amino acid permease [Armatimonadota bacterium]NIM76827.1 amino acid permease [Armatimonadota bacterium]NIN06638.1 amino acid permease [Armatimonadota bacterium]